MQAMKKQYLFFILVIIHFSFCYSQNSFPGYNDTIFKDRSHKKIVCKIVHSDNYYVYYKLAKDTTKNDKMELWRIKYIHYGSPQVKALAAKTNVQPGIANKTDTTPQLLFGQVNLSFEFPSGNLPYIGNGVHIDYYMEYFFTRQIAVTARAGLDILTEQNLYAYSQDTYTIQQYMGGLSLRLGNNTKLNARNRVPGPPWIDFIAMGGLVMGHNPKLFAYAENSSGTIATGSVDAGTGYGLGGYAAIQINSVTKKLRIFSIGIGYLFTTLSYNNYTYNVTGVPGSSIAGQSFSFIQPGKFKLGIVQPHIGIGF